MKGKFFLKLLLSITLATSAFIGTVVSVQNNSRYVEKAEAAVFFTDVTETTAWYYKPVYWAAENGIATGTSGKFTPAGDCERKQIAAFIWRAFGRNQPENMDSKFVDYTDKSDYAYKAIMWANENGIITGTGNKFFPKDICTREQAVTMIWRAAGKPEPLSLKSPFKDVTNPGRYSYKAILWAAERGITTGTNGKYYPEGKCLRREIVTFIYRYFQSIPEKVSENEEGMHTYVVNSKTLKFHFVNCSAIKKMNEANKETFTGTRSRLIAQGYSPCGICKP